METTTYIALSKQVALRRQMDQVAQNLANMNTSGFKSAHMLFTEYLTDRERLADQERLSMVNDYGQYRNFEAGSIQATGNELDFALQGKGYFAVLNPQTGEELYTRNGNFRLNENKEIVTGDGWLVANRDGGSLTLPAGTKVIKVNGDGSVEADGNAVGQLKVVEFENQQLLKAAGGTRYNGEDAVLSESTQVQQGALEGSNVNPMLELTEMIDVSRDYQRVSRVLEAEHERQNTVIRKLGQLS